MEQEIKFNGEIIPSEVIVKCKKHFINLNKQCIADAISGKTKVNDLASYIKWQNESTARLQEKETNFSLTFLQHAYFIMTGKSVALLP